MMEAPTYWQSNRDLVFNWGPLDLSRPWTVIHTPMITRPEAAHSPQGRPAADSTSGAGMPVASVPATGFHSSGDSALHNLVNAR